MKPHSTFGCGVGILESRNFNSGRKLDKQERQNRAEQCITHDDNSVTVDGRTTQILQQGSHYAAA